MFWQPFRRANRQAAQRKNTLSLKFIGFNGVAGKLF
jgi:hypothetical protein